MDKKEEIKTKIIKLLDRENRSLSIREIAETLTLSGAVVSQPTTLNYLKELESENKIVEVKKHGKKVQNNKVGWELFKRDGRTFVRTKIKTTDGYKRTVLRKAKSYMRTH